MADPGITRVAVYIDFDNIVISRYDQVHGRSQFQRDKVRASDRAQRSAEPDIADKLRRATVDIGAVIDFASSFGTLVLTRAYADWSDPVNADYRGQLVSRAVDLVQLFPAAAYAKNGADIRLAVDAVEDMFRLPDLTHVVIVAGDSDYIALAQRCRRLGRYVVGVGVAGSTSRSLAAACDELVIYDALPGVAPIDISRAATEQRTNPKAESEEEPDTSSQPGSRRTSAAGAAIADETDPDSEDPQKVATRLLERALRLGHEKDDAEWLHSSAVKSQMKRMDPSFSERALGYRSFSDFVRSREDVADLDETTPARLVRLNPTLAAR
ncbi:NYN domain-containing protein [Kribbella jejuensis]|nr:NYN domain-containing protein [Kribbella jejuensis]